MMDFHVESLPARSNFAFAVAGMTYINIDKVRLGFKIERNH